MKKLAILLCSLVLGFGGANSTAFAKSLATNGSGKFANGEQSIDSYNQSIGLSKAALHCLEVGLSKLEAGSAKDAIAYFDRAIALNPRYASAFNNRGNARCDLGDSVGAERDFKMAIKLNPNFASPWNNLGTLKYNYDLKGAVAAYSEAIRIHPGCAAYDNRANAEDLLGDSIGALRDFDEAIKLNPNYARAFAGRGALEQEFGELDYALEDCNHAIKLDNSFAWAYEARGKIFSKLERHVEALADFNEAVRLDRKSGRYYRTRGLARAADWRDLHGAIEDFDKQISLDPKLADGYLNRAQVRDRLLDRAGSISDLEMAVHLEPHCVWAYSLLGDLRSDAKQSIKDFSRAIAIDPTFEPPYHQRGYVRAKIGDLHEAIHDFSESIKLKPQNSWSYSTRGSLRGQTGDVAGAIADLSESIRLDSHLNCSKYSVRAELRAFELHSKSLNYCERGMLRARIGDCRGAIQDWVTAMQTDPGSTPDYLYMCAASFAKTTKNSIFADAAKLWQETRMALHLVRIS